MAHERHPAQLLRRGLAQLLQLILLGLAVGAACLPLNWLDALQDSWLRRLPAFGGAWDPLTWALLLAPLLAMPLLTLLQARPWASGAGSGIPQTMHAIEEPDRAAGLMAPAPTVQRLSLWSIATLALFPLGREGPVVQVGAAAAHALRRRFPRLLGGLGRADLLAVAGGAGLAAGFNTPLVGVVFMAEELTGRFIAPLLWPTMVVAAVAAMLSSVGGQPEFALGLLRFTTLEPLQALWALPLGLLAGLVGGLFSLLLLRTTRFVTPLARRHPLPVGLALGAGLALLALVSGGASGGDGEALMALLINDSAPLPHAVVVMLARFLAPCLALGAGVPGGLIDPALSLGALLGKGIGGLFGIAPLALALGMAGSLAGATQLPVLSAVFSLRLAGDQQLLPGIVLASVLGAGIGRLVQRRPIYHALAEPM
ncbi:MAG: chloride channel protein [Cyanobium sp.]